MNLKFTGELCVMTMKNDAKFEDLPSLFLRYKKISKKAVKTGGFLQCSVHIFLGHDGCF